MIRQTDMQLDRRTYEQTKALYNGQTKKPIDEFYV